MELQRGTCFTCRKNTVVNSSQSQKAHKIISFLLKEKLDTAEFSNVQSSLRVCPICYHKLIIMKRTIKHVEKGITNEVSSDHCHVCKSEKNLFRINNWPSFNAISEDMGLKKKNCITCSDCLFYLETRNELKSKLFSKYPQLENKPLNNNRNKRKWKLKFSPDAKLQSTPLSDKNKRNKISRKRKLLDVISISDNDSDLEKTLNLNPLKNLKPLKYHKLYKNNKTVKMDFKFLNQIPYVLVNSLSNTGNDTTGEHAVIKYTAKEENENTISEHAVIEDTTEEENENTVSERAVIEDTAKEENESTIGKHTAIKYTAEEENENIKVRDENLLLVILKNELVKHGINKNLVVNVSRMKIDKYQERRESDPDIQNLIDKFSILHSSNQTEENESTNIFKNNLAETEESLVEETEMNFEIKTKRKSVSFAEEKNVEIEYFENEPNIKFKNYNLDEDLDVLSKKQSKGILKREESIEEQNVTLEEQNKTIEVEEQVCNKLYNTQESNENQQNQEDENNKTSKIKIKNRRDSRLVDEHAFTDISDSDSDIEILSQILNKAESELIPKKTELTDISVNDENNVVEDENVGPSMTEKIENNKPKPFSKRKRRNTIAEDTNVNNRDDDDETSEDVLMKRNDLDVTAAEQPSQDETNSEENKSNTEDSSKSISVDEKAEKRLTKKEKPKPLSKKKNVDKSDECVTSEDILEKSNAGDVTVTEKFLNNETKSEEINNKANAEDNIGSVSVDEKVESKAAKKEKPKPLSKRRKIKDKPVDEHVISQENLEKSSDLDITTAEHSLQDNTESENNNGTNTEDSIGSVPVDEQVEKATKRERPKPLSKKRKLNIDKPDTIIDEESSSENDTNVNKGDEIEKESVNQPKKVKKNKPKPLSKKKKLDKTSENIKADNIGNNVDDRKEEDLDDSDKEKSIDTQNISSEKEVQNNSNNLEEHVLSRTDDQMEDGRVTDEVVEVDNSTEKNEATYSDAEKEKDSLDSGLEDKSSANNSLDISEYCKELEKDKADLICTYSERDSTKPDTICEADVSQLVNKYLNNPDEDGSSFLNSQKDDTLEESTNHNSNDIQTDDKVDNESKNGQSPIEPFNEFKTDDLGISEVDHDNINSILSHMFPSELPDDKLFEIRNEKKIEPEIESAEDTNKDLKKKLSDDELNTSKEKKKKKVTFCDDVT